jgi:O-antigen/teichoic acid export membrane protein
VASNEASLRVPQVEAAASPRGRASLFRRVAAYGISRSATELLLGLRSVLLAAFLGPAAFGIWALLRLGMRYSALAGLGVFRGLEMELLHADREGKGAAHDSPARTALGFILLVGGSLSALALVLAVLLPSYRLVLAGFAVASLAELVYGYALVCTRVRSTLRRYAVLETSTAALHVVSAVGLAHVWGLGGAFAGLAIANLIGVAGASHWVEFRPTIVRAQLKQLMHIGIPVALTNAVGILLVTADRWIVAFWGGATMLGYYAFGASVTTGAMALALVVRTVVFRQVYGDTFESGAAQALRTHLERSLLPFARLLPPLLGAVGLAVGPVVALLLPRYTMAIAPARLFLLAGAAIGLVNLAAVGAIAAGRQRKLPAFAAIALAITASLSLLALKLGGGLEGVAAAALAGHVVYAAAVLRIIVRETGATDADRFVGLTILPLIWCAGAVALAGHISDDNRLPSIATGLLVYIALLLPLMPKWRTEWRRLHQ